MLKFGIISEVIAVKGMARVKFDADGIVSAPLHCAISSSLNDQVQFPYNINQHVYCIMDDRCERGVIAGAIYDEGNAPEGGDANIVRLKFKDGLELKYDRSAKKLSVLGTGDVELNTDGGLDATVTGDANVKALNATVEATVKATMKAPVVDIDATTTNVTGVLNVTGVVACAGIAASAGSGGSGDATIAGDLNVTGTVSGGAVKEGAIQLGTHKHSGVTTGGGISGTPTP